MKKLSTAEFVEKAIAVHKGKYDYSLCEYVNSKTKVKIICPEHGLFEQAPSNHLRGANCSDCGDLSRVIKSRKTTTNDFVAKAIAVHGRKYDYSFCNYVSAKGKVKIVCPEHGAFEQSPNNHLSGCGCLACGRLQVSRNLMLTTDDFIQKANQIHNYKYDYSLCEYVNTKGKVKIICPEHGLFEQVPNYHIGGSGCPYCGLSSGGFDASKPGVLYFVKLEKPFASFWKIGITNRTVRKRFGGEFAFVTTQYSWELENGFHVYRIEQSALKEFQEYKFDDSFLFSLLEMGGNSECFVPTMPHQKVIDFIEARVKSVQSAIAA